MILHNGHKISIVYCGSVMTLYHKTHLLSRMVAFYLGPPRKHEVLVDVSFPVKSTGF
jgi:hypothetical protein